MQLLMTEVKPEDEAARRQAETTDSVGFRSRTRSQVETHGLTAPKTKGVQEMATLNDICKEMVTETPDAVAANVVDLESGMMLGGHFTSDFTTDHFEAVSAAATNLYRGKDTLRVEQLVKAQRGDTSSQHFMEDVQFSTTNLLHFIRKLPDKEAILCLVTRKPGNVGMGWAAIRSQIAKVSPLVPS